jgi:putative transposase
VRLCRVLGVSPSGYYAWRRRGPSQRAQADLALTVRIRAIHQASRQTYGAPPIHAELQAAGVRWTVTTQREPTVTPAPDRLRRQFVATAPHRIWTADSTYVPTWAGCLYLAVVLDVYSRRIVGWAMADHRRTELVRTALEMALWNRRPAAGVIHHSDQGCQYAAHAFQARCRRAGIVCSMGSVGDAYDNAITESFFATLACALLRQATFRTHAQARSALFAYIEGFYNSHRRHSALEYLSPTAYERRAAACVVA